MLADNDFDSLPSFYENKFQKESELTKEYFNNFPIVKKPFDLQLEEDIKIENFSSIKASHHEKDLELSEIDATNIGTAVSDELEDSFASIIHFPKRVSRKKKRIVRKKYKIFDKETKKNCVKDLNILNPEQILKKYGVSVRSVYRWRDLGVERKAGSGKKIKIAMFEKRLIEWYNKQEPKPIDYEVFREAALKMSYDEKFRASIAWLKKIKRKYGLKLTKVNSLVW